MVVTSLKCCFVNRYKAHEERADCIYPSFFLSFNAKKHTELCLIICLYLNDILNVRQSSYPAYLSLTFYNLMHSRLYTTDCPQSIITLLNETDMAKREDMQALHLNLLYCAYFV